MNDSPIFLVAAIEIIITVTIVGILLTVLAMHSRSHGREYVATLVVHKTHEMTARVCAVDIYFLYFYTRCLYIFGRPYVTNKISFLT